MKNNERNAGRKAVPNPIRKQFLIPKNRIAEIETHVVQVQNEEIYKAEQLKYAKEQSEKYLQGVKKNTEQ